MDRKIDAIRMSVLLIFPIDFDWLIVLGDDELNYRILEFFPQK